MDQERKIGMSARGEREALRLLSVASNNGIDVAGLYRDDRRKDLVRVLVAADWPVDERPQIDAARILLLMHERTVAARIASGGGA